MDKCIDLLLRDEAVNIDTAKCVSIKKDLKWRSRFYELGSLALINKLNKSRYNNNQLDEVNLLLRVHYKWLIKFSAGIFGNCDAVPLGVKCRAEIKTLFAMIDEINKSLSRSDDSLRKISKRMKKALNLPSPCSSEIVANVFPRLSYLSEVYCTAKKSDVHRLKRDLQLTVLQKPAALETRFKLMNLWQEVYARSELEEGVLSSLLEMENTCEEEYMALKTPVDVAEVLSKVQSIPDREIYSRSAEVQLWPIYEYILLIFAKAIQAKICQKLLSGQNGEAVIPSKLLSMFARVPTVPINVLAILNAVISKLDDPLEAAKLLPELFLRVSKFTEDSSAVKNPERMLRWCGVREEDPEDQNGEEEVQVFSLQFFTNFTLRS